MATRLPTVQSSLTASTTALNSVDDSLFQQGFLLGARASSSNESIQTSGSEGVYLEVDNDEPPSIPPRMPASPMVSRSTASAIPKLATPKSATPKPETTEPAVINPADRPLPKLPSEYFGRQNSLNSEHIYSKLGHDALSLNSEICISDADKSMMERLDISYPETSAESSYYYNYDINSSKIKSPLAERSTDEESSDDGAAQLTLELAAVSSAAGKKCNANLYASLTPADRKHLIVELPSTSTTNCSQVEIEMQPLRTKARKSDLAGKTISSAKKAHSDVKAQEDEDDVPFIQTKWGKAVVILAFLGILNGIGSGLILAYKLLNADDE